jgi:hypothetical protein
MLSWREQADKLSKLIKKVSDQYGGDDADFLETYTAEIIAKYRTNLQEPIACFESLVKN